MNKFILAGTAAIFLAACSDSGQQTGSAARPSILSCENIAGMALADRAFGRPITGLTAVSEAASENAPAHCHIRGMIWPATEFHLMLPENWNGRFVMTGNGGPAGPINPQSLIPLIADGYAAAGDSGGHMGDFEVFSYMHPDNPDAHQKMHDLAYRSIHETTQLAKQIIEARYGQAPAYSYFIGGSQGGRQALMSAQRYPQDFDGWVAGRAVSRIAYTTMAGVWNSQALLDGESRLPLEKVGTLAAVVLNACDAVDGVEDGLISAPLECELDLASALPLCPAGVDHRECFTGAQVEGLIDYYGGPRTPAGEALFVPAMLGSEQAAPGPNGMNPIMLGELLPPNPDNPMSGVSLRYGESMVASTVYTDPDWDWRTEDWDDFVERVAPVAAVTDATNTNLQPLIDGGKKLIMYHGLADTLVTPMQNIRYYQQVIDRFGADTAASFSRLYLIPGLGHGARVGPMLGNQDARDWLPVLVDWVENGRAPQALIASRPANEAFGIPAMTRPLCPYPERAIYHGEGDIYQAQSFSCGMPQ